MVLGDQIKRQTSLLRSCHECKSYSEQDYTACHSQNA
jgi:hypothetical protein